MKLPKYLIAVTPLSKLIALILFILLPIFGFCFGRYYQNKVDPPLRCAIPLSNSK